MTSKLAFQSKLLAAVLPVVLAAVGVSPARAQAAPNDIPEDPYDTEDDDTAPDERQATPDEAQPPAQPEQAPLEAPPQGPPPQFRAPPQAPPPQQLREEPEPPPPQQLREQPEPPPPPQARPLRQAPPPVAVQAAPAPSGQWVHTQQYGWVWMPYGDQYVYTPEASGYPYEYVYAPSYGWTWLAAPWVWGWGPRIYFSVGRPYYFGWYRHPHFVGRGVIRPGLTVRGFHGPARFRGSVRAPVFRGPTFRGGFGIRGHIGGRIGGRIGGGHFGHGRH